MVENVEIQREIDQHFPVQTISSLTARESTEIRLKKRKIYRKTDQFKIYFDILRHIKSNATIPAANWVCQEYRIDKSTI